MDKVIVAALYKFVALEDFHQLREPLLDRCIAAGTRGTLLLAHEGINGTIAGSREAALISVDPLCSGVERKIISALS